MAHTHALSGAVAWLAASPWIGTSYSWKVTVAGTIATAGAALLPDLDHHRGTAANMWGPVSRTLGRFVSWASGGHRAATHSIGGVVMVAALAQFALDVGGWWTITFTALLAGLCLCAWEDAIPGRWERLWPANLAASFAMAWWVYDQPVNLSWVPLAVAVGTAVHIAGDMCTDRGVPLLYPIEERRFRLAAVTTGGRAEAAVAFILVAALVGLGAASVWAWPASWMVAF